MESLTYELSSFDGSMQESGTLDTGFDGVNYYCLSNDCYLFTVPNIAVQKHLTGLFLLKIKSKYRGPQVRKPILVLIKYVNL